MTMFGGFEHNTLRVIIEDTVHRCVMVVVVSQFNGTTTPNGSYSAKTGDNGCNVKSLQSK